MSTIKVDEKKLEYALRVLDNECMELYEHYFEASSCRGCKECLFYNCEKIKEWLRRED